MPRDLGRVSGSSLPWFAIIPYLGLGAALLAVSFYFYNDSRAFFLAVFFGYFIYGIGLAVAFLVLAAGGLARTRPPAPAPGGDDLAFTVTVAVPAHDEADVVVEAVRSLLGQSLAPAEIIVVNDGSTDDTLVYLIEAFDLQPSSRAPGLHASTHGIRGILQSRRFPTLWVIDKQNAGKAAALNTAHRFSAGSLFVTADADCLFLPDALARAVRYFHDSPDVVAAGGIVVAANGLDQQSLLKGATSLPRGLVAQLQFIEYATGFIWRFAWARLNSLMLLSGGFSVFRSGALRAVGGFDEDILTEDYEIAYRLHEHCRRNGDDYRILMLPDPVAYTLVPETLGSLIEQRTRWFQGFLQTLTKYRHMVFDRQFGWFGVFALPIKAIDAVMPFWGLFTYVALADHLAFGHFPVPLELLLGLVAIRWGADIAVNWMLIWMHRRHVAPRMTGRQYAIMMALAPLNMWLQRLIWYAYGFRAYWRLWQREQRWVKAERRAFGAGSA